MKEVNLDNLFVFSTLTISVAFGPFGFCSSCALHERANVNDRSRMDTLRAFIFAVRLKTDPIPSATHRNTTSTCNRATTVLSAHA